MSMDPVPSFRPRPRPMIVAGMMSGTSADGIDIAFVRIAPARRTQSLTLELLLHRGFPFSVALRAAVLAAQDAQRTSTAELARLNWRLGLAYARAFEASRAGAAHVPELVGCHGQTIYHQAKPALYTGLRFGCTWQIGEMAPLANAAGVPVVSNFRPADMVAGGQGAPLVPLLDQTLYQHASHLRVLQNIGGIGNLTLVPTLGSQQPVIAFDTGPGNMVIDALMQSHFDRPFDRNGAVAASGRVLASVLQEAMRMPFLRQKPPRSAGREQFGEAFTRAFVRNCRRLSRAPEDAVATATAFTAHSIATAIERYVLRAGDGVPVDVIVSGGGARNATLMQMLRTLLVGRNIHVFDSAAPSLPSPLPVEAKEATAFALLAYASWHRLPGNVPSATGASRPAILGQVTCA